MDFESKKAENCFANAENYQYRIELTGAEFVEALRNAFECSTGGLHDNLSGTTASTDRDHSNADKPSDNSVSNVSDTSTNASNASTNTNDVSANTSNASTNTNDVSANTSNASTNTSDVSDDTRNASTNTADVSTNTTAISSAKKANSTPDFQIVSLRINKKIRRPTFIVKLENGIQLKGLMEKNIIKVGYVPEFADKQRAAFEEWLTSL